jgi:hypothetical protein
MDGDEMENTIAPTRKVSIQHYSLSLRPLNCIVKFITISKEYYL